MNDIVNELLRILVYLVILWAIIWGLMKSGVVVTSKQLKKLQQDEIDTLAKLPPEVRQLRIEANRKVADFKFSFGMLIVTSIVSFTLIYWFLK